MGAQEKREEQRTNRSATCRRRFRAISEVLENRILLTSAQTTQDIDFVRNVWNISDTANDAIIQTLNTNYDGHAFSDWINLLVNGLKMGDQLSNGKFSDAASTALNYGLSLAGNSALESAGLLGVASVAQLAAWPIENQLQTIAEVANTGALQTEAELYFHARMGGTTAQSITDAVNAHQVSDFFDADGEWTVYMEGQGWLLGQRPNGTVVNSTPLSGITPIEFYQYEEKQFAVQQTQDELADDSEQLKEAFYDVAHPGAPVITSQPTDQSITSGGSATLNVQVTGSGSIQYQWLDGSGSGIAGADSASYSTDQAGQYSVAITNGVGAPIYSHVVTVTVNSQPVDNAPTPSLTSLSPAALSGLPLPQTQLITINGSGFTPHSTLEFFDGTTTYYDRPPIYVSNQELQYNIRVGDETADWTATVLNGSKRSHPFSFTVTTQDTDGAPAAPINPVVSYLSGPVQNIYAIDWTNPGDSSGISKIWYKIGSTPASSSDGTALDVDVAMPLWVASPSSMPQTIYMWLEDGAGNKDQAHAATAILQHDPLLPHIDITSPTSLTSYTTSSDVVFLSGISSDAGGTIESMTWSNNRGGSGTLGAGSNWSAPPIALYSGINVLTISATDSLAEMGTATLTVTYTPPTITKTWTGMDSSEWNDANNWAPIGVPTGSDIVEINGGSVNLDAGFGVANLFLNGGTLNWTGGLILGNDTSSTFSIAAGSVVNMSGSDQKTLSKITLNNNGLIDWSGGSLVADFNYGTPVTFNNLAGGTFNLRGDNIFATNFDGFGSVTINNAGLIRRPASANPTGATTFNSGRLTFNNTGTVENDSGTLTINAPFNNDGTAKVVSGSFTQSGGGTSGGTFDAAAGTSFNLSGGTFNTSAVFTGQGITNLLGGAYEGTLNGQHFVMANGGFTAINPNGLTLNGMLNWTGGIMVSNSTLSTLTIAAGSVVNMSGSDQKTLSKITLNNNGLIDWSGGSLVADFNYGTPVTFNNLAGGTFNLRGDNIFATNFDGFGSVTINNAGLIRRPASANPTGATTFNSGRLTFNNTGTVENDSGTLTINAPFNNDGILYGMAGTIGIDGFNDNSVFQFNSGITIDSVAAQIKTGFNSGTWTGGGIKSTVAASIASDNGNPHKTAIGYATAGAIGVSSFDGMPASATTIVGKYTFSGDANLDGIVNALDFNALATNFGKSGQYWFNGDFNYDGTVDSNDFAALAANYGSVMTGATTASGFSNAKQAEPAATLFSDQQMITDWNTDSTKTSSVLDAVA